MDIFFLILVHLYFHHCFFGLNNIVWIPRVNEYKVVHCSTIREDHWSITCTMNSVHIPSQSNPNGFCAFLNDKMSSGDKLGVDSSPILPNFLQMIKKLLLLSTFLACLAVYISRHYVLLRLAHSISSSSSSCHHHNWFQSITQMFTMNITNRPRVGDPPPLRKYKVPNEKLKQLHRWGMKSSSP